MKSPYTEQVRQVINTGRGTMGAVLFDGESCHVCRWSPDTEERQLFIRLNIDGVWTVLCYDCRKLLIRLLNFPWPKEG